MKIIRLLLLFVPVAVALEHLASEVVNQFSFAFIPICLVPFLVLVLSYAFINHDHVMKDVLSSVRSG